MFNTPSIEKLTGIIELYLEHASRINERKPRKYWYPLSLATYGTEEVVQALDSLCSFRTTMWEKTLEFENRFARFQGSLNATMVNSGSSADLLMSFLLLEPRQPLLRRGDEILVPAVTWPTQIWSPMMAGLRVRLVDVDPATLNVSLQDLERKITPATKAIFLVHLMGNPCEMRAILDLARAHNLIVLEDACEALGSSYDGKKVGNFGLCSSFSFFFAHHICTMEGGMICSNDPTLVARLRTLRAHGWTRNLDPGQFDLKGYDVDPRYAFVSWGFNVRPTELQAGFGLAQLQKLPSFNARRVELANRFFENLPRWPGLSRPAVSPLAQPVWFALPLMVDAGARYTARDLTAYLEDQGVETRPIVTGNIVRHPAAKLFSDLADTCLPGAEAVHARGLYLGLSPMFSDDEMQRLIETIDRFFKR